METLPSGDSIESVVQEINETNNTTYDAKAIELLLPLDNNIPRKKIKGGKKDNPQFVLWLESEQSTMWKTAIDYINSIQPEKKMNAKQKRPNENWSEWNRNYNSYIKTYEKFLKLK